MRTAYRVLAYLMALEVVIQAAAIAWAVFGLNAYIEGGGSVDKAAMESDSLDFNGVAGFAIHGMNGTVFVPVIAIVLFVVSFFAKIPRGVAWAGGVLGLVALQILLGIVSHSVPALGMLHGVVALVLLVVAIIAGRLASTTSATDREPARVA